MFEKLGNLARIADALEDLVKLQAARLRGQAAVGDLKSLQDFGGLLGTPEELISYVDETSMRQQEEEESRQKKIR